jgi:alginate O-acetyltransferase complex protein AlgI
LPIVFTLYWFVTNRSLKLQNSLIVVASYIFYSWWDWRFLSLVALSTGVHYLVALKIEKTEKEKIRKRILAINIAFNLGLLCSLKYFNFFAESFSDLISLFGLEPDKVS